MSADPVYERRELVRTIKLPAKQVQRSIQSSLLAHLKTTVLGKCGVEGYLSPDGVTILQHSIGQVIDGYVLYQVKFQVDVCFPHKNQSFKAPAVLVSRIGVKLEQGPMRILLPRDMHIDNADFESIKVGDEVIFTVVGSEFKQDDSVIFLVGQLLKKEAEIPIPKEEEAAQEEIPVAASGEVKQVKTVTAAAEAPKRRKKVLAPAADTARSETARSETARSDTLVINPSE
jgi:DNA-directed RNA polymerase subunit E'/Rpb7